MYYRSTNYKKSSIAPPQINSLVTQLLPSRDWNRVYFSRGLSSLPVGDPGSFKVLDTVSTLSVWNVDQNLISQPFDSNEYKGLIKFKLSPDENSMCVIDIGGKISSLKRNPPILFSTTHVATTQVEGGDSITPNEEHVAKMKPI